MKMKKLLILNKPPNLVIHSAPSVKEATLVDWLQAQGVMLSTLSGAHRAGIVHRLDKRTSGAIAIAKTNATHAYLSQQLKDRAMGRYYLALIDKPLKEPRMITCNLARHPNNRLKMANIDAMGQKSLLLDSRKVLLSRLSTRKRLHCLPLSSILGARTRSAHI